LKGEVYFKLIME